MPNERGQSANRRPDYEIKALNKDTQARQRVGAAWLKDDGSGQIYIKLEPFVTLSGSMNIALTAFPTEEEGPYELPGVGDRVAARSRRTTPEADEFSDNSEDDRPPRRRRQPRAVLTPSRSPSHRPATRSRS